MKNARNFALGALAAATALAAQALTIQDRTTAAQATAQANAYCQQIRPFYWSIGNQAGWQGGNSIGLNAPTATTQMRVASASKWVYAAYVAQYRGANGLSALDWPYLHFTSGYTNFTACATTDTVKSCANTPPQNVKDPAQVGKFYYGGGHMQNHEVNLLGNLDGDNNVNLALAINNMLGTSFSYVEPQLAGGIQTSAQDYGTFLQKIVTTLNPLRIKGDLGLNPVCSNPLLCPNDATYSPMNQTNELKYANFHYSAGHWVEDDMSVSDGAFSSAGAFGFYPWVDSSKTWWGIVAREADLEQNAGQNSLVCGKAIRKAWMTGYAQ